MEVSVAPIELDGLVGVLRMLFEEQGVSIERHDVLAISTKGQGPSVSQDHRHNRDSQMHTGRGQAEAEVKAEADGPIDTREVRILPGNL